MDVCDYVEPWKYFVFFISLYFFVSLGVMIFSTSGIKTFFFPQQEVSKPGFEDHEKIILKMMSSIKYDIEPFDGIF